MTCYVSSGTLNPAHITLTITLILLLRPSIGAEYCDQPRLSVRLCVREHISGTAGTIGKKFCMQMPSGRGSALHGGVALRYVLPVLWMTSVWP